MYCINCGTQLPDDAGFCLKCGTAQKPGPRFGEPKWETCEIQIEDIKLESNPIRLIPILGDLVAFVFGLRDITRCRYVVRSIGPKGMHTIADTGLVSQREGLENLIARLAQDGWESSGRGEQWYNYKFRRRAS